ncbi:YerC/YecD family TrpR-related protein [Alkalibacter saccharofermentans]|uniref:Trp operon repressor family n=1 Tax=Alkalibacter saccharofermentans DSM 14828 TaxID=1120975 RepID=A0A1M4UBC1_9FIRM|nr:YerC/YecD family TrpR-related protein [Alkalibacter saccharofermentans]SHE53863.1 Trp operon repressor family [Alkalibacter saccharofermentans DSM 14828]
MNKENFDLLLKCLSALESTDETLSFLEDLCTIKEIEDMQHRLEIAQGLFNGKTFSEVQEITGASSTTVSRVSRCLKYGTGYKTILEKIK